MKRRLTILSLMGLVLVLGVAIAALRNADDYWAGGMILATPFLLGVALIAALCGEERSRARRLGFTILGGGYFALAFLGLSEPYRTLLPTSRLLAYVHQQVAPRTGVHLLCREFNLSGPEVFRGDEPRRRAQPLEFVIAGGGERGGVRHRGPLPVRPLGRSAGGGDCRVVPKAPREGRAGESGAGLLTMTLRPLFRGAVSWEAGECPNRERMIITR